MADILPRYNILSQQPQDQVPQNFGMIVPPTPQEQVVQLTPPLTPQHDFNGGNGAAFAQSIAAIINAIGRGVGATKTTGGYDKNGVWTGPMVAVNSGRDNWLNGGKTTDTVTQINNQHSLMAEKEAMQARQQIEAVKQAMTMAKVQQALNQFAKEGIVMSADGVTMTPTAEAYLKPLGLQAQQLGLKSSMVAADQATVNNPNFQKAKDQGAIAALNSPVIANAIKANMGEKVVVPSPMLDKEQVSVTGTFPDQKNQSIKTDSSFDPATNTMIPGREQHISETIYRDTPTQFAVNPDLMKNMPSQLGAGVQLAPTPAVQSSPQLDARLYSAPPQPAPQIQGPPAPSVQVMPQSTTAKPQDPVGALLKFLADKQRSIQVPQDYGVQLMN